MVAATNPEKVRHPVLNYDDEFAFIPYIKKYYPNSTIKLHARNDLENMRMPTLQVALYGHFLARTLKATAYNAFFELWDENYSDRLEKAAEKQGSELIF